MTYLKQLTWVQLLITFVFFYGNVEGKNSKTEKCRIPMVGNHGSGTFERINPSSKYIIVRLPPDSSRRTRAAADEVCGNTDYEVAQVEHEADRMALKKHLFESVWIGLTRNSDERTFLQDNGGKIVYQSFVGVEPNNKGSQEGCVILKSTVNEGQNYISMEDVPCESEAGVLCQYKKGSPCYMQSSEEIAASEAISKPRLVPLGSASRFYISQFQESWDDAYYMCMQFGYQLITLNEEDEQKHLSELVKGHIETARLNPATQFWTGGTFEPGNGDDKQLLWIVGEDISLPATETIAHTWAPAGKQVTEPFEQSGFPENCLDISFENAAYASSQANAPYWRASNCKLPKYFICEKVQHGVKEQDIRDIVKSILDPESELETANSTMECAGPVIESMTLDMKLNLVTTEEDLIKFMLFHLEHDLKSGKVPLEVDKRIAFKETVISLLVDIGRKSVSPEYVDHGLLNIAKVINLLYQNTVAETAGDAISQNALYWTELLIPHLSGCASRIQPLSFSGTGYEIVSLLLPPAEGKDDRPPTAVPIEVPEEFADTLSGLDSSVDILWFLFSLSLARCYRLSANQIKVAADYHVYFVADFIDPLRTKWTINVNAAGGAKSLDYKMAMGDVDFATSMRNLRHVVTAGYKENGIEDLQLVRPLDMTTIYSGTHFLQENAKTGRVLFSEDD